MQIFIQIRENKIILNRDYFFKSKFSNVYVYVIDINLFFICVRNESIIFFHIRRYFIMNDIVEFEKKNIFKLIRMIINESSKKILK